MDTPSPVNSVALTCDFLRAQPSIQGFDNSQFRNLEWLEKMIGAKSRWEQWGVKTSVITVPMQAQAFRRALGNDTIFSAYTDDADQAWASMYDTETLNVFPKTLANILEHDLIVGFEIPPTLKRAINAAGKRYISFYIHPVRFLRDLCFLATSNSEHIADLIAKNKISSHEIDSQVRRFSAKFSRLQPAALSLPEDVPVLIGQMERDSILIKDGKFTAWEDYENHIENILSPYSEVVFLEHPYRKNSSSITEHLRGRHGKTVVSIRGNSYGIIFSKNKPPFFLTLASSLGAEARCVGHKCVFLSDDPCKKFILAGVDIDDDSMVSHAVFQDDFWKNVFNTQPPNSQPKIAANIYAFPLGDHYIRNSLDVWAFGSLQSGSGLEPALKKILPAASATDAELASLSAKLCDGSSDAATQLSIHGRIQQPWGIVEVLAKPMPQGLRTPIDFSKTSHSNFLSEGFHAPEDWGVWSSGKYLKLIIPVDLTGVSESILNLSMTVEAFSGIMSKAPVMQISVDGKEVGIVFFREYSTSKKKINFNCIIKNPSCHVEFIISHSSSPAQHFKTDDVRELGFSLSALSVFVSPTNINYPDAAGMNFPVKFWGISDKENVEGENSKNIRSGDNEHE